MEYQKPEIEIMWLYVEDIVCSSLETEEKGDGDGVGDGTNPWE